MRFFMILFITIFLFGSLDAKVLTFGIVPQQSPME